MNARTHTLLYGARRSLIIKNAKAVRVSAARLSRLARPVATNNLARLSKGKMIGVRYNKDKEWVGGSFCLFENQD